MRGGSITICASSETQYDGTRSVSIRKHKSQSLYRHVVCQSATPHRPTHTQRPRQDSKSALVAVLTTIVHSQSTSARKLHAETCTTRTAAAALAGRLPRSAARTDLPATLARAPIACCPCFAGHGSRTWRGAARCPAPLRRRIEAGWRLCAVPSRWCARPTRPARLGLETAGAPIGACAGPYARAEGDARCWCPCRRRRAKTGGWRHCAVPSRWRVRPTRPARLGLETAGAPIGACAGPYARAEGDARCWCPCRRRRAKTGGWRQCAVPSRVGACGPPGPPDWASRPRARRSARARGLTRARGGCLKTAGWSASPRSLASLCAAAWPALASPPAAWVFLSCRLSARAGGQRPAAVARRALSGGPRWQRPETSVGGAAPARAPALLGACKPAQNDW